MFLYICGGSSRHKSRYLDPTILRVTLSDPCLEAKRSDFDFVLKIPRLLPFFKDCLRVDIFLYLN